MWHNVAMANTPEERNKCSQILLPRMRSNFRLEGILLYARIRWISRSNRGGGLGLGWKVV